MQPGDLVQAQRQFWASDAEKNNNRRFASKLAVSTGDILLLTAFDYNCSDGYDYDFFTFNFLAAGCRWSVTITVYNIAEVEDFIKVFESPTLLPRG